MSYLWLGFLLYILFLFEEIKLVISNHFGIVRLKTQSEKYMALKDEISRGVMWLRYMPQRFQTFVHLFCLDDKKAQNRTYLIEKN